MRSSHRRTCIPPSSTRDVTLHLLLLRLRMIWRFATELLLSDPYFAMVILAMLSFAQWRLFASTGDVTSRWFVVGFSVAVMLSVHTARRDERFLRTAGVAHRRLFAAEYLLLCLPFSIPLVFSDWPHLAAVGPGCALLLSLLPAGLVPRFVAQRAQRRSPMTLPLPDSAFEWLAGVRRSALWLSPLYLASALLSRHFGALLVVMVLLVLTPAAFYQDSEGSTLVEVFALSPRAFLRHKIARSLVLLWGLATPVAVLSAFRHPLFWYAPIAVLVLGSFVLAAAVLIKYAFYREGARAGIGSQLAVGAVTASLALFPVTALLLHVLWKRSVRNLEPYLHAFDR
jgi:hypothetical protein